MELVYASEKVKTQCTSVKAARKLFGVNNALATSLHARINALEQADTIKGIIIQPLDANKAPFNPCYIDQIAEYVRIVEIMEVSKHYE